MCLLAAVLALGFVRLGVEKTMPDYPDSLGDSLAPEKITGEYLLRTAAAQDDMLPVFGSSELKTTQICTHPANFFAGADAGEITPETELFEEGLLDSFGLVELLVRLEQFGKTLDVAELTREEISTPAKIAALLT